MCSYRETGHFRNREAFLSELDSRSQNLSQGELPAPKPLMRVVPASSGARNRRRMDTGAGDLARLAFLDAEVVADGVQRALGPRPAGAVHGLDGLLLGIPVEEEHIAADASRNRLCDI